MEQFQLYSVVWEKDRETVLEEFMKSGPQLGEFEQQITFYAQIEEQFNAEPEHSNVGPIAIFTGRKKFSNYWSEAGCGMSL